MSKKKKQHTTDSNKNAKSKRIKKQRITSIIVFVLLVLLSVSILVLLLRGNVVSSEIQKAHQKTSVEENNSFENVNFEEKLFYDCIYAPYNSKTVIDLQDDLEIFIMTHSTEPTIAEIKNDSLTCILDDLKSWSLDTRIKTLSQINITVLFNGTGENNQSSVNEIVSLK